MLHPNLEFAPETVQLNAVLREVCGRVPRGRLP